MSAFNPFDIPEEGAPESMPKPENRRASQGGQTPPEPAAPKRSGQPPQFLDKLPKNGFGRFVRRFWRPLAIVVALVLVLAIFGNAIMVKLAPEWAVGRGAAKTTGAIEKRIGNSPYKAVEIFWNSILSGSMGCEFTESDGYTDMTGRIGLTTALKDKSLALSGDVTVNGRSLDGELFLSGKRAALRSSWLDDCYGVTYETFEDDLRASALPDYLGMTEEDIREAGETVEQFVDTMDFDLDGLIKSLTKVSKDFMDDLDFASSSEKTSVGGKKVSCTAISAGLDERQLRALVLDCYDAMTDDESVRSLMVTGVAADNACTPEEAERLVDKQLRANRQSLEAQLRRIGCDLDVTYYLYKNQLVKLEMTGDMTVDGETARAEYVLDFGRDPEVDDWSLECLLTSDYGDRITLSAAYETDVDGKSYSDRLTAAVDQGWGPEGFELATDWNKKTGDLELLLDNGYGTKTMTCNLVVEGDSFALRLDDGDLPDYGGYLEFVLTCDKAAKIEKPDYVNLDKWDADVLDGMQRSYEAFSRQKPASEPAPGYTTEPAY